MVGRGPQNYEGSIQGNSPPHATDRTPCPLNGVEIVQLAITVPWPGDAGHAKPGPGKEMPGTQMNVRARTGPQNECASSTLPRECALVISHFEKGVRPDDAHTCVFVFIQWCTI